MARCVVSLPEIVHVVKNAIEQNISEPTRVIAERILLALIGRYCPDYVIADDYAIFWLATLAIENTPIPYEVITWRRDKRITLTVTVACHREIIIVLVEELGERFVIIVNANDCKPRHR